MKLHQLKDSFMCKPIVKGDYDETCQNHVCTYTLYNYIYIYVNDEA